ncbi:MAG TPA: NADH-quinone oxidoreductase subunit D [Candidatus Dormibacteraeota bacterium]|jgi:NADH-quinone oxidoreductase subunit D|nr:NADH-quinone oxidoreductase subunit D [Candidatus Dormibacteraeota bacterium]
MTELKRVPAETLQGRVNIEEYERSETRSLRSDLVQVNVGPHHPSTHGVLHFFVTLDGETVVDARTIYGYLHRSMEKLFEGRTYVGNIALTDRMDYTAAMLNNWAWCLACEKLAGLEVNERSNCLRTIAGELSRLSSHLIGTGVFGQDVGVLVTSVMWGFNWREEVIGLLDDLSGARMMYNWMRPGGVAQDCPDFWPDKVRGVMDRLPRHIDDFHRLMTTNEIFRSRTIGVGVLSAADAIAHSVTGPTLRGSGVPYDVRRAHPYGIYSELDFDVPIGERGDCYDRYIVRIREMEQSRRIILQALERLEQTEAGALGRAPKVFKPAASDTYAEIEGAKGCLGVYLKSDGGLEPYRAKLRSPSFLNLQALPMMVRGWKLADLIAIFGSIDINMGEVDR